MREAAAMPQPSTEEGQSAFQRIQELIVAAADGILAPSEASPHRSNRSPCHNHEHCQDPTPQPGDDGGEQGGGRLGGGGRGHSPNGGSHEDDRANDDSRSTYCSDGKGDTRHDGRNPRNRPEQMPRAAGGDPYDLVGPPAFGYRIQSALTPRTFVLPTLKNMTMRQT
jgi:hypothetical protein